jgi:flagellar biosynthesis protein FlhB
VSDNRSEKATPKRREDARKKGQVARRPDLAATASFLAALLMLKIGGGDLLSRSAQMFRETGTLITANNQFNVPTVHTMMVNATATLALLSLPIIAASLAAGVASNFAQGGLTFAPQAFMPRAERFNPVANLKKVFGSNGPVELLKGFLKLGGLVLATWGILGAAIKQAPSLIGAPSEQTFSILGSLIYGIGLRAGVVLFMVSVLDYGYGWYKHEKSLKMTKQEIRDEFKKQEGDPLMKSLRRRAARQISQKRVAAEVPKADVIVTNPTHLAIAIRYDRDKDAAPRVLAKGADLMAKRIRELAKSHNIPVVENKPLARSLYKSVDMGQMIPAELFRAVAELLAYVYRQRTSH